MSLITVKGIPALVWGTGTQLGAPAGSICASLRLTPKNGGPMAEIEDGSGIGANLVLGIDGFNAKATVMNDTNKTFPVEGANVGIAITMNGINATSYPFGVSTVNSANVTGNTVTYFCTLASIEFDSERKKEQMVNFSLIYRPNIAP